MESATMATSGSRSSTPQAPIDDAREVGEGQLKNLPVPSWEFTDEYARYKDCEILPGTSQRCYRRGDGTGVVLLATGVRLDSTVAVARQSARASLVHRETLRSARLTTGAEPSIEEFDVQDVGDVATAAYTSLSGTGTRSAATISFARGRVRASAVVLSASEDAAEQVVTLAKLLDGRILQAQRGESVSVEPPPDFPFEPEMRIDRFDCTFDHQTLRAEGTAMNVSPVTIGHLRVTLGYRDRNGRTEHILDARGTVSSETNAVGPNQTVSFNLDAGVGGSGIGPSSCVITFEDCTKACVTIKSTKSN